MGWIAVAGLWGLLACTDAGAERRVVAGVGHAGFLDAMRLAIADELALGPLPGLDTVLIEAVSNRAAPAVEVADSLTTIAGLVAVVGHANSQASLATAPIYNAHRVVQVAPTSTAPAYSDAGPFSFRTVPPDAVQGAVIARELQRRLADRRIAVSYVNDDYGRGLRQAVMASLDTSTVRVVAELPHNEGDVQASNPAGMLAAIAAAEPDLLLWLGRVPVLNELLPSLRAELGALPILTGDAASWAHQLEDRIVEWNGVEYLDFVDMESSAELRRFRERMADHFQTGAAGPEALIYDATRVVLAALRAGATSGEDVRAYLLDLGRGHPAHDGLTGSLAFDEQGDAVRRSYVLRKIEP